MKAQHDRSWRSWGCAIWAVLTVGRPISAADPTAKGEPAELNTLRLEYQQRILKARAPADDWYRMQLRLLLARYKQAGNLDAATAAQAEMDDPDPTRPLPSEKPIPPDLAGVRSAYVMNARRLTEPVDAWYRQQMEALERSLVQRGDLAGAQAVRNRMGAGAPPAPATRPGGDASQMELKVPWGGRLTGNLAAGKLEGPGKGFRELAMAMALTDRRLKGDFKVQGEIQVSGICGGIVVGRDENSCATLYWCKGHSVVVWHDGASRRMVAQPPLPWKPGRWQELAVERQGDTVMVRLDGKSGAFGLPPGTGQARFGFMVAGAGSCVEFRKIAIVGDGGSDSR